MSTSLLCATSSSVRHVRHEKLRAVGDVSARMPQLLVVIRHEGAGGEHFGSSVPCSRLLARHSRVSAECRNTSTGTWYLPTRGNVTDGRRQGLCAQVPAGGRGGAARMHETCAQSLPALRGSQVAWSERQRER